MARAINQVNLMGRLTRDPEQRMTTTDKMIASFSIAVDRGDKDGNTDFFDITAWNQLAEIVTKYTKKGSKVYVSGRLQLDRWESDGQKKSRVSIIANDVVFLESAKPEDESMKHGGQFETLERSGNITKKVIDDKPVDLSEIPF